MDALEIRIDWELVAFVRPSTEAMPKENSGSWILFVTDGTERGERMNVNRARCRRVEERRPVAYARDRDASEGGEDAGRGCAGLC